MCVWLTCIIGIRWNQIVAVPLEASVAQVCVCADMYVFFGMHYRHSLEPDCGCAAGGVCCSGRLHTLTGVCCGHMCCYVWCYKCVLLACVLTGMCRLACADWHVLTDVCAVC